MTLEEAIDLGGEIVKDSADVPEEGEDFADGVANKALDIMETIERTGRVTPGQESALLNMRRGLDRWLS